MKPTIELLVARAFAARTAAHEAHLRTRSYAEHIALGEFYASVGEAADAVAEFFVGAFGKELAPAVDTLSALAVKDQIQNDLEFLEENLDELSQGSESLSNKIQELIAVYARALYFLRFK